MNTSFSDSEDILYSFIKKTNGLIQSDQHLFFLFLPFQIQANNNNFDIKKLLYDINVFQNNIINNEKLDSRNILLETKETIINSIKNIFNYFNNDFSIEINYDKNDFYDITKTINILIIGKRGAGKSTFINRILGEKKAYAQTNSKTLKTKEYCHKYYPIKFIDSAGFEVGELNEIKDINNYLKKII